LVRGNPSTSINGVSSEGFTAFFTSSETTSYKKQLEDEASWVNYQQLAADVLVVTTALHNLNSKRLQVLVMLKIISVSHVPHQKTCAVINYTQKYFTTKRMTTLNINNYVCCILSIALMTHKTIK